MAALDQRGDTSRDGCGAALWATLKATLGFAMWLTVYLVGVFS